MEQKGVEITYFDPSAQPKMSKIKQYLISVATVLFIFGITAILTVLPAMKSGSLLQQKATIAVLVVGAAAFIIRYTYKIFIAGEDIAKAPSASTPSGVGIVITPQGVSFHRQKDNRWLNLDWQNVTDIELQGKQFVNINDVDFNGVRIGIDKGNGQPNMFIVKYRKEDGTSATFGMPEGLYYWQNKVIYDTLTHYYQVATGRRVADDPLYRSMTDDESDEVVIVSSPNSPAEQRPTEELRYRYSVQLTRFVIIIGMLVGIVFFIDKFGHNMLVRALTNMGLFINIHLVYIFLILAPFTFWLLFKRIMANRNGLAPIIIGPQGLYIEHAVPGVPTYAPWSDVTAIRQNIRTKIEGQRLMKAHDHYYVMVNIMTESGIVRSLELDEVTYRNGDTIYDNMRRYWEAYR